MLSSEFQAKVGNIGLKVKEEDDVTRRTCEVTLHYDLTGEFAQGIGGIAPTVQKALADGDLTQATIPVDALDLHVSLRDDDDVEDAHVIKSAHGVKAVAKRPNKEDPQPTVAVSLSFPLDDGHLLYLAHRQGCVVTVRMDRTQTEIPGTQA